jgi:hypothetical protein
MLDQSTPYIQAAGYLHHSRPVISSGRIQDKLVWLLMCLQGYAATSYQGGLDQSIGARARRTSSHKALHKMSARMRRMACVDVRSATAMYFERTADDLVAQHRARRVPRSKQYVLLENALRISRLAGTVPLSYQPSRVLTNHLTVSKSSLFPLSLNGSTNIFIPTSIPTILKLALSR